MSFIKGILLKINLDINEFSFSLSEVPSDINNEGTWKERLISAKLFYNLLEDFDIYISTQFFGSDRIAVIDWYKEYIE